MGNYGYHHMMDFSYGGMFMWILWIIIIGAVVYAIAQNSKLKGSETDSGEKPLDILKKRYAKGEITKEEFDKIKKDLA